MISVSASEAEWAIVEEFFQLFKTPWKRFEPSGEHEIVLSTGGIPAECNSRLVLVFSSKATALDQSGFEASNKLRNRLVRVNGQELPIYGDVATSAPAKGRFGEVVGESLAIGCERLVDGTKYIHLGYDLFSEIQLLLGQGQPAQNAGYPTLDLHIEILRELILQAGIPVVEIPPEPAEADFISCLTHDIDFVSLRQHRFDRAMCGFFYRASVGTLRDFFSGRCSAGKVAKNAAALLKWPLVQLGLCEDFWLPFKNYVEVEQGRPSTFFVLPFKNRCGKEAAGRSAKGRAVRYDVEDVKPWLTFVRERGCEVAVHGIDSWESRTSGAEELQRISSCTGEVKPGVRMHWLFFSERSPRELEAAGYDYDSTCGYNEAVGYRAGTSQVFQLLGTAGFLELPLHAQDTAMFYPGRMHLTEAQAWPLFMRLVERARAHGGVITVLWHDRSLVPERLWGDFYARVLNQLSENRTWFATARNVVAWFRKRRQVKFAAVSRSNNRLEVRLENVQNDSLPGLTVCASIPTADGQVIRVSKPAAARVDFELAVGRAEHAGLIAAAV